MGTNDEITAALELEHDLARVRADHERQVGKVAAQDGIFHAEVARISEENEQAYQERLQNEQRVEQLKGILNADFILTTFKVIEQHHAPAAPFGRSEHLGDMHPHFGSLDAWLAHYKNTIFAVPPQKSRFGETVVTKRSFKSAGIKYRSLQARPIPLWVVGECRNTDSDGNWQYLAVGADHAIGYSHDDTYYGPSNYYIGEKSKFSLLSLSSKVRLSAANQSLPTEADAAHAYDPKYELFHFNHFRSPREGHLYPQLQALQRVTSIDDFTMQSFGVTEKLMYFPAAYEIPEDKVSGELDAFRRLRQGAHAWDGRLEIESIKAAFGPELPAKVFMPLLGRLGVRPHPDNFVYDSENERSLSITAWRNGGYYDLATGFVRL